eukprot:4394317-Pyramimonas_sp.AAC.1
MWAYSTVFRRERALGGRTVRAAHPIGGAGGGHFAQNSVCLLCQRPPVGWTQGQRGWIQGKRGVIGGAGGGHFAQNGVCLLCQCPLVGWIQ